MQAGTPVGIYQIKVRLSDNNEDDPKQTVFRIIVNIEEEQEAVEGEKVEEEMEVAPDFDFD